MIRKLIIIVGVIAILSTLFVGTTVFADTTTTTTSVRTPPSYPVLTDSAFLLNTNMRLVDLTGAASTTNYKYVDLLITSDTAGAVVGAIKMYPTNNFTGVRLTRGTSIFTSPRPSAAFTMHFTKEGTLTIFCPKGVAGTATSGTATVGSSPLTLVENTANAVSITGTGTITIALHFVYRSMTVTALGFVGTGYHPHISLVLADDSGYFAGTLNGTFSLKADNSVRALQATIVGMIDINGITAGGQTVFNSSGNGIYRSTAQ